MIGRLHGTLLESQPPYLLVDVGGVGYEVQAPMTTFYALPEKAQSVTLYTHLAVSETSQQLFGFAKRSDRDLFRTLIKVNGVGPKMAVAILSGMDADQISRCVHEENVSALVKVPGVGKKTAERLVIELRDKLKFVAAGVDLLTPSGVLADSPSADNEAESALIALGYKSTDATRMVAAAQKAEPTASAQELIRLALKKVAG